MKIHLNLLLLIFTIILIVNCDKDPVGPTGTGFIYPLKVGNQWEYDRIFSIFNIRPDSSNNIPYTDTTITFSLIIEIIREEPILDSINFFVFQQTLKEFDSTIIPISYYANLDSGLYFYANSSPVFFTPKASLKNKILFKGRYFNNIREITSYIADAIPKNYYIIDSSIFENPPPLLSLKYPLEIGSQWAYRHPGIPWNIDKKILNSERVIVPAGRFVCFKIQWLFDINQDSVWDDDIIFYDYVCAKGLIKRSILYKDLIYFGEMSPEPLGLRDSKDEIVLTKLTL